MMRRLIIAGIVGCAIAAAFVFSSSAQDTQTMSIPSEIQAAYSNASAEIQQIAADIHAGQVPDKTLLDTVGIEALNTAYGPPDRASSILLNDTLLQENFPAAQALVAAGANVRYARDLMVFNALDLKQGRRAVPFTDYSQGIPFLQLYLENGGDPNAQYLRDNSGRVALLHSPDNLQGMLMLLDFGADPWLEAKTPQGTNARSFYDTYAFSSSGIVSSEILFRIAHAGHFAGQRPDQIQMIYDDFERSLSAKAGSTQTDDLHAVWRRQTILDAIIATSGVAPNADLAELLQNRVSDTYGGWHLRPDQYHSGDEFIGPAITHGTVIWTHTDPTPSQRPTE